MQLTCYTCEKKFERKNSEAKRNAQLGMRTYCSRKCRGKKITSDTPPDRRRNNYPINKCDELSPFRPHIKTIISHCKKINKKIEITAEDLKSLWEEQNGICPLTGWSMLNYKSTRDKPLRLPERASVDRIDSNGDYTKNNIRFICMIAQFAKNNFTEEQLLNFCESVVKNKNGS